MECKRGMRKYGAGGLSGAAARTGDLKEKEIKKIYENRYRRVDRKSTKKRRKLRNRALVVYKRDVRNRRPFGVSKMYIHIEI